MSGAHYSALLERSTTAEIRALADSQAQKRRGVPSAACWYQRATESSRRGHTRYVAVAHGTAATGRMLSK